jgi:hypothetical protein
MNVRCSREYSEQVLEYHGGNFFSQYDTGLLPRIDTVNLHSYFYV